MEGANQELARFYAEVDQVAAPLSQLHGPRLKCGRGCSSCCKDDLSVFEIEAENIRSRHQVLIREATPHPVGGCAFLDEEGGCRIYADRPYVCRTQGLPLRWLEEQEATLIELRDICPLNEEGPPIETLPESECWTVGSWEGRLAGLQQRFFDSFRRIQLRTLF